MRHSGLYVAGKICYNKKHSDIKGRRIEKRLKEVALYFTIFPSEKERYNRELEEQEAEQEAYETEQRKQTEACVNKMTKAELRAELMSILESYDEVYTDFVMEHNLW